MKLEITAELLSKLMACRGARRLVDRLLPMTFNTDPEENITTARDLISVYQHIPSCEIVKCDHCRRGLLTDLKWFAAHVNKSKLKDLLQITDFSKEGELLAVMQAMAIIADISEA